MSVRLLSFSRVTSLRRGRSLSKSSSIAWRSCRPIARSWRIAAVRTASSPMKPHSFCIATDFACAVSRRVSPNGVPPDYLQFRAEGEPDVTHTVQPPGIDLEDLRRAIQDE